MRSPVVWVALKSSDHDCNLCFCNLCGLKPRFAVRCALMRCPVVPGCHQRGGFWGSGCVQRARGAPGGERWVKKGEYIACQ